MQKGDCVAAGTTPVGTDFAAGVLGPRASVLPNLKVCGRGRQPGLTSPAGDSHGEFENPWRWALHVIQKCHVLILNGGTSFKQPQQRCQMNSV